jgi:hypothetical protein
MNPILHDLQNKQWIFTGARAKQNAENAAQTKLLTGFDALDNVLSGGFPKAGMIHLHSPLGCGEMRFMLSILQQTQTAAEHKLHILIDPPFEVNAEFLLAQKIELSQLVVLRPKTQNDALWSAEQCAKSGACQAIFVWQQRLSHVQVRKLELASQQGDCYCIWLQNTRIATQANKHQSSSRALHNLPLTLSLSLSREFDDINITVNKQKVGWAQKAVRVPLPFTSRATSNNRQLKQRLQQSNNNTPKVVSINASR